MSGNETPPNPGKSFQVSVKETEKPPSQRAPAMLDNPIARLDADVAAAIAPLSDFRERIEAAMRQVHDPEIPVNIFDLGLIYEVDIKENNDVHILMTLTSPACPAAQELPGQVRRAVSQIPEAGQVEVEMTFDPPWSVEHMSDVAKIQLGMM